MVATFGECWAVTVEETSFCFIKIAVEEIQDNIQATELRACGPGILDGMGVDEHFMREKRKWRNETLQNRFFDWALDIKPKKEVSECRS